MNAGTIRVVDGQQLCEQQYIAYREKEGYKRGYKEGELAGIRKMVELDKQLAEHILQDGEGNWSIESWRLKEWFKMRQAQVKKWLGDAARKEG